MKVNIWWINPVNIFALLLLIVLYAASIDSKTMMALYNEPDYITADNLFVYFCFFFTFVIGFATRSESNTNISVVIDSRSVFKVYKILIVIVFSAYLIWFVSLWIQYGSNMISNLLSNIGTQYGLFKGRGNGGKISGVTTFTEMGIIVAPLGVYLLKGIKLLREGRKFVFRTLFCLFMLALLRSAIFAERIAFLELVIPSIVVYLYFVDDKYRKVVALLPVFGCMFLLFFFGLMEYNRSWISYYARIYNDDIVSFTVDRLTGYYATAINTECIQVNYVSIKWFPTESLSFLWKFPGLSGVPSFFCGKSVDFLTKWGNPEFNNPGGILCFYKDFGFVGLIPQFFFGKFCKSFFLRFKRGDFYGFLMYPVIIYGMFELPRYQFFCSEKMFYVVIGYTAIKSLCRESVVQIRS